METSQKNVITGFSPRVYPRPEYAPLTSNLTMMAKEIFYQSGFLGTCCTFLLYPFYTTFVSMMRHLFGPDISERMLFVIVFNATHLIAYATWNSFFGICDYAGFLQKYKLPRKDYMRSSIQTIVKTIVEAAIGQIVINPLLTYYVLFDLFKKFGMSDIDSPLPTVGNLFAVYCFANFFNSFFFYWAHRIFHSSLLYSRFHKQHHEYRGTMGISAEHAGTAEQILANGLPTIGGALLFGTHPLCVCVALYIRLQQTYEAHSGYCFRGTLLDKLGLCHPDATTHHDYHHTVNSGNFGVEWMDWFCGTQDTFVAAGGTRGYELNSGRVPGKVA